MSKPRIRPRRHSQIREIKFECQGIHPDMKIECWAYGRTIKEAYKKWLYDPLPF